MTALDHPVERVRAALRSAGLADAISEFPEGTRTAAGAAAAIGCGVAEIAKSIVFRAGEVPVLAIASGANRVSKAKLAGLAGAKLEPAGPDFVLAATGFAAGGVSPLGHRESVTIFIDRDLMMFPVIWAAAGSPHHVFPIAPAALAELTGGVVADIRQE
ncbi:YbaK/EbsC family protein [Acidiphilium sp. AL]|uniref:YbaK/EbsC family protein n=1 Tax=Acidiphilium iwatense TaxID=768198 RepID=A0ABS9DVY4_9PROT|nr:MULTISPECIES: YbaK/EbsC family protein [Acidiphilium]MCF3946882.1 YbaK/EbsC family protein [Acidiphilium iwatense]MCU4161067.1 YbaK/EbsC family protein [Acidiphilium sp. AL]